MKRLLLMVCVLMLLLPAFAKAEERDMAHYLLIGVDGWGVNEEGGARSDAIILASLDYDRKKIILTSFARDSLVKPSYRKGVVKLNTLVRSSVGEHVLIEYMEETFGIGIDGYFVINFSGAVDVINAVGGINLELDASEAAYLQPLVGGYEGYPLKEGWCLLNGEQAIYYMRCRSLDNDFGRQRRHGQVLQGLLDELSDINIVQALMLLDDVMGMYRTDMTIGQQIALVRRAVSMRDAELEMHSLPDEGTYRYAMDRHGSSGVEFDVDICRERLYGWLDLELPEAFRKADSGVPEVQPERTPIVFAP